MFKKLSGQNSARFLDKSCSLLKRQLMRIPWYKLTFSLIVCVSETYTYFCLSEQRLTTKIFLILKDLSWKNNVSSKHNIFRNLNASHTSLISVGNMREREDMLQAHILGWGEEQDEKQRERQSWADKTGPYKTILFLPF